MAKDKAFIVLLHFLLWVISLLAIAWLWNRWMLDGPHGAYRWVGMDFAPFWVGVHEMFYGINPYSPETTIKIQEVVYGSQALSGQDPMMFVYPAWVFIVMAPFSIMPYKWAVILYEGSLLWAMLLFLYNIALTLGNKKILAQSFWLVLLTFGSLPFMVISVTKGQLGYLSLLALFSAYKTWKQKPILAGILLGFALIKPTVTVVPVIGFQLWVLLHKNWKFLLAFTGCMVVFLATSYLAVGNWIPSYLGMLSITGGMPVFWSFEILPTPLNILYTGIFIFIGIVSFFYSFTKKEHDYWFSAVVLLGIALTPMRWIYDLFLGILILAEGKNLSRFQSLMAGVAIISPWALVLVPKTIRWNVAVIGLPLIWATTLLVFIFAKNLNVKEPIFSN